MAEVIGAAAITTLANHRVEAAGSERWETFERLADEGEIFVDLRRSRNGIQRRQTGLSENAPDSAVMHVQLARDRTDAPFLHVVIAQNVRLKLWGKGHNRSLQGQIARNGRRRSGLWRTHCPPERPQK
jgi:hypothetical protein